MTQIDVNKGLQNNAEDGISEEEKSFYRQYDNDIVRVKSGLVAPSPAQEDLRAGIPAPETNSESVRTLGDQNNLPPIVENKTMPLPVADVEAETLQAKGSPSEPLIKAQEAVSRKEEFIRLREKLLSNKCRTMKSCHFTLSLPIELKNLIENISVTFHYPRSTVVQWLLIEGLNNEFDLKTEKQFNLNQED